MQQKDLHRPPVGQLQYRSLTLPGPLFQVGHTNIVQFHCSQNYFFPFFPVLITLEYVPSIQILSVVWFYKKGVKGRDGQPGAAPDWVGGCRGWNLVGQLPIQDAAAQTLATNNITTGRCKCTCPICFCLIL